MKAVEYINRRREKYCIKAALSKTGKKRYYIVKNMSKVSPEELLHEIPPGFEFYEHPRDAMVVLRKIPMYNTNDAEVEIVNSAMKQHDTVTDYIVEKSIDHITIYTGCCDVNNFSDMPELVAKFHLIQHYDDVLRFEKKKKIYLAQRFCCLSRDFGWITMERNRDLRYLAEKYCYHTGKDSLLDFWKEGEI
jgi:hypothetical protein